ncbi:MAG: protein kinase domain-containing protein, partial [Phototrophicaceae bacterium]
MTNRPSSLLLTGQMIKGYEFRELLGTGGFGAVYRAFQPAVGREVAVKVILPEFANQPDFVRKFEAEVQIVARLEHFHIIPLYDYWREPDGAYFVMRLLRGGSVRDLVANAPISIERTLQIVDQVAAALMAAHRNKVIHRDLKPDNIMLDEESNAYLTDFGIAKLVDSGLSSGELSQTVINRQLVGSPAYSSPEQIRAEGVTPLADQYSLGIVVFEMLTGVHPFPEQTLTTLLMKQLRDPLPDVKKFNANLPGDLDIVLGRATEKAPADRYHDVQEFSLALHHVLQTSEGIGSTTLSPRAYQTLPPYTLTPSRLETLQLDIDWGNIENPFKGLRAFQEADADDFFGREEVIKRLLDTFANTRLMALVGPSGSGKSSVVKAGMLPALRDGKLQGSKNWFIVEMVPGAYPLEELEATLLRVATRAHKGILQTLREKPNGLGEIAQAILPDDDSQLVLYIDQFEEVFTFVEAEEDRAKLLSLLLNATKRAENRVRVILTLRADFYDRPLLYPEFGELFRRNTEVILPMSENELAEAIIGPINRAGLQLETGLIQSLVNDVKDQPGALPLLQYALTELFERRDGPVLTMKAYADIGGAMGALARRADELYVQLDNRGKETSRQLFLRLVTLGEGTEDTRRRVLKAELISLSGDDNTMEATINTFSRYRLLTLDRDPATRTPTVEIAHESLIREWGKLRDWLNSSREDMRLQRRVLIAAEDWRRFNRDASYLARGTQLETFAEWAINTQLQLTNNEQEYLNASIEQNERLVKDAQAQQAREAALERRSRNILRVLVGVLIVALAVALGLSVWATNQRLEAERSAVIADRAAAVAQSFALAANSRLALLNSDIDLAVTLALAANEIEAPPPIAQNILFEVAYTPGTQALLAPQMGEINAVAALHAPERILYGTDQGLVGLWDATAQTDRILLPADGVPVNVIAIPPDQSVVMVGGQDGTIDVLNAANGERLRQLGVTTLAGSNSITAMTYTQDGAALIVGLQNGNILLIDPTDGHSLQAFGAEDQQHRGTITNLRVSPDGLQVVSTGVDRSVRLWTIASGQLLAQEEHAAPTRDTLFINNGTELLTAAQDGELVIRDPNTLAPIRAFQTGHILWEIEYGPDDTLFTAGQDGILRQWELVNGGNLKNYIGHISNVLTLAPTERAGNLVTGSADGTVRLWNFYNRQIDYIAQDTGGDESGIFDIDITPDGQTVLTGGSFGSLKLWDANTGVIDVGSDERIVTFNTSFTKVAFILNNTQVLGGSLDGGINAWDIASGQELIQYGRHRASLTALVIHPDQQVMITAGRDRTTRVWNLATGDEIMRLELDTLVTALAYSPDGGRLLVGDQTGSLRLLDGLTFAELYRVDGQHTRDIVTAGFSPDGRLMATGSLDRTAIIWNSETGELVQRISGHAEPILTLAFSPNGSGLVTASGNQFAPPTDVSIRLWDVISGQELRRFGEDHASASINDILFSPDGDWLYSADADDYMIRWEMLTFEQLRGYTQQNRYARPLTCAEQSLYGLFDGTC